MWETAVIVAAIGAETALSWWQGRRQEALLSGIYLMLAQSRAVPARKPAVVARPPNGNWRRGWPSILSGRLVGIAEQPAEEKAHPTEHAEANL